MREIPAQSSRAVLDPRRGPAGGFALDSCGQILAVTKKLIPAPAKSTNGSLEDGATAKGHLFSPVSLHLCRERYLREAPSPNGSGRISELSCNGHE